VSAFEDQPEPIAGEHPIPQQIVERSWYLRGVALDHVVARRQPRRRHTHADAVVGRPRRQQVAEVEQRVTDRGQLPVHHRRHCRPIATDEHVAEVEVAVHHARPHVDGQVRGQPLAHHPNTGDVRPGVAGQLVIAVELRAPAADLTRRPAVEPAEIAQPHRDVVDCGQRDDGIGHRQAHRVLPTGVVFERRRQAEGGVEAVDRLHQVERRSHHLGVGLGSDEAGMRHIAAGQRRQHTCFASHRLVAVGPLVHRRPAQHEGAAAAREPQQHVLRAACDERGVR
jgi:hypothetical protein